MTKLELLKRHLRPGEVYRRQDLQQWSTAVDRHLRELIKEGTLEKLSGGLYYFPRQTVFGKAPAEEMELLATFLKDHRFLVTSPNDYNALGVGTTQLYNTRKVYNHKRHGDYKLGNRTFHFVRKPFVPKKVTPEFLLVDLANNLKDLAEDLPGLEENVKRKAAELDHQKLRRMVNKFGTVGTKKLFASTL
jgi:hypothetical protein